MASEMTSPARDRPTNTEVGRLQRRVDELAQQLLGARDAVVGAEAELGAARGRVVDLEHRLHVLSVENEELRAQLDRRPRFDARASVTVAPGAPALAARLTPGVARRAVGRSVRRILGRIRPGQVR